MTNTVVPSAEELEKLVSEPDLATCGCILKDLVAWRVLKTQARNKILEIPVIIGEPENIWTATEMVEDVIKSGNGYAIRMPLYACGHDELQWQEYWRHDSTERISQESL